MSNKFVIAGLIIVLFFLIINMFATINTMSDYEQRKESGNDRWLQVENRILKTEEKVKTFGEEMEQWKNLYSY